MKLWIKIILGLAVVGIIAAALVYTFYINKSHPDYEKAAVEIKIKAKRLYTDFSKNAEAANVKYTGNMVLIEGSLSSIETPNDSTVTLVYVYNEGDFGDEGIRVDMLPQFHAAAKQLSTVKSHKIKGLCTGYNDTDVIMEKGSIIQK